MGCHDLANISYVLIIMMMCVSKHSWVLDVNEFSSSPKFFSLVAARCSEPAGREIEMVSVCAVGSGSWLRKDGLARVCRALLGSHRAAATGVVS